MMRGATVAAVAGLFTAGCSHAPPRAPAPPGDAPGAHTQIGTWGLDLAARDPTVKPGDDFYRYAEGLWLDSHHIPPDRNRWGSFDELDERSQQQLHELVDALPAEAPAGSNTQKAGDYYRAFLDTAAIEQRGLAPARAGLDAIAAAASYDDLARLMGRTDLDLTAPLGVGIVTDQKDPDHYVVSITQSGLGLPDRDYYLKDDKVYAGLRSEYRAHIARLLTLAGAHDADADAQAILDIETRIAKLHWPAARRRERDLTYNARTPAELEQLAPQFHWPALLAAAELDGQSRFVVRELDAVQGLGQLFAAVPVGQWRAYFTYHYLADRAAVLPLAFDEECFGFYGRALAGRQQQPERWKRGVGALDRDLGEAVGELYVQHYFPRSSKQQVLELVENLRAAYAQRIAELPWMTAATKKLALEKLAAFHPKIGYPDRWRDYAALSIVRDDAFGNADRARVFEWHRRVVRLGGPTDRLEWGMTPQTINAYYNPTFNEVVFPAAILQPPFFDPHADAGVNYGGIGAVIGHEMGHGFDDQGSKSDARGVLHTWWDAADTEAFRKRVDSLAAQYDEYVALPGLKVNGRLTLGENIGDLGGLSVAYEAYHRSLEGRPAPVLDGLTGDQRFFLAYAQVWRTLISDERLRTQVLSNPHSPANFRVNGVVRNVDAWYQAFAVQPGDKLYLPQEARVHIW
jgi:predicted metalloendopeptidase